MQAHTLRGQEVYNILWGLSYVRERLGSDDHADAFLTRAFVILHGQSFIWMRGSPLIGYAEVRALILLARKLADEIVNDYASEQERA